eukprot:TRINITY_DN2105_c0_g1_i1.p1 TRINITY_DN2105_c0_g1~~TRINITY_DN2105_c0_g1_i1.p1  ORF type:complete len:117 (+),score=21.06 TRINITY_DN2105_c0_g1_i1:37-351(+)
MASTTSSSTTTTTTSKPCKAWFEYCSCRADEMRVRKTNKRGCAACKCVAPTTTGTASPVPTTTAAIVTKKACKPWHEYCHCTSRERVVRKTNRKGCEACKCKSL